MALLIDAAGIKTRRNSTGDHHVFLSAKIIGGRNRLALRNSDEATSFFRKFKSIPKVSHRTE
jgi:hypothetical protein